MKYIGKLFGCIFAALMICALFCVSVGANVIEAVHGRTEYEIAAKHIELAHDGFDDVKTTYAEAPVLSAPYSAGSLSEKDLKSALNTLKMIRFLAGVPYEDIRFTDELNSISQHGAVLLAASDQFTHTPGKPADMSQSFFDLAYKGCSEANLNAGKDNISSAVLSFAADSGKNNIASAGHRRWMLKPGTENFGIGFAKGNGTYGGLRTSLYIFGDGAAYERTHNDFIAWPNAGAFPLQYFAASDNINSVISFPWSVNLGSLYAFPKKSEVIVTLTRASDGKVWSFDTNTPNLAMEEMTDEKLHLSVDNSGYGMTKAIIFRPDLASLGVIADGETFTVEISGIKYADGTDAVLSYDVNFFNLERAVSEYNSETGVHAAMLPAFPVTMNGVTIDNSKLRYPFILYNDITYFPMTYFDSRFLGVETNYTPETGLEVVRAEKSSGEYKGELWDGSNPAVFDVLKVSGTVRVNGKVIDNNTEEYPLVLFRDITYFPMTWRFCVDEFGWDYWFDGVNGLVINTVSGDTSYQTEIQYTAKGFVIVGTNPETGDDVYLLVISSTLDNAYDELVQGRARYYYIDESYGVAEGEVKCLLSDNGTDGDVRDDKLIRILSD